MNTLGLKTAKLLVDSIWNNNNNHTNDTLQSRDQLESSINIFIHFISNNNDNNNKNRSSLTYPDLIVLIKMLYIYLNRYSDISSIFQSQIYQLLMSIKQSAITSTTQIMTANSIGVSAFEELSDITQKLQTQSISSFSSHQDVSSNAKTSQLLQILLLDVLIVSLSDTARISRNNKKIFTKFCQVLLADSLKLIGYLSSFRVPTIAFLDASTTTQSGSAKINISSSAIVSQIIKNYQDLWSVALFSDSNILDSLVSYQFPVKLSSSLSSSTSHILGQTNTHTHSVTSNPVNSLDNESSHHLLEQDTKPDVEVEAVEDVTISNNNKESKRVIGTAYYTLLFDVILEVIPQLQTTSSATATTYTSTSINTEGEESAQCIYEESSTSLGLLFASIISSAKRQFTLNGSYHDSKYEKQNINGTNSKSISNTINSEKKIQYFERVLQLFFLFYKLIQVSANSSSTSEMDMSSNQNKRQKLLSNKPNSDSATNAISSTTNVFTANSTISSLWMLKARNSLLSLLTTEFSNSIPYHKSLLAHQQRLQDLAKQWIIQASASNSGGASASTGSRATDVSRVQSYSVSDAFLTLQLEAIHMLMIIDHRTVLSLKDLLPTNTTQTSTASTITDTETTTATASSNPASKKRPIQKQSSTVAVVGDGGNPMYTLLEILVEYDSNSIIKNSDNSNNSGNDSSSSVSHSKGGNVALLSVKKRVLCRIIDTLAKLQRVPELVRYLLRSNKSWIPTETTHTDTADSSSKPLSPTSGTATGGLIEQARSSILCSTEVQSSLCRAFDGLQTVQHPPVWNVLIDLCYFKIVKDKKKTPAEYLASSAPSATVTAAKQSIGSSEVPTSSGVVSISGQVNHSTTIQDTSIKLNILNYNLCPLLSAMSQSVASSVHTVVLPESVLFRFFEKVIASTEVTATNTNPLLSNVLSANSLIKNELLIPLCQFLSVTLTHTYSDMQPSEEITKVSVSWPSVIHSCFSHLESIVASLPSIQSTDNLHSISDSSSVKEKVNVTDKLKKTPKGHKLTSEKSEQSIPKNNNDNMEMANIRLIQSSCTATSLVSFIINAISCCGPTILSHTDQSALAIDDMNESTDSNTIIQPFSYLDKYLLHVIASLLKSGILTSVDHSEDKRHIVHIQSIVLFLFRTTYLWENIDWIPSVMIQQLPQLLLVALKRETVTPSTPPLSTSTHFSSDSYIHNLLAVEINSVHTIDNPILFSVLIDTLILCLSENNLHSVELLKLLPRQALIIKQVSESEINIDESIVSNHTLMNECTATSSVLTTYELTNKKREVVALILAIVDKHLQSSISVQTTTAHKKTKNMKSKAIHPVTSNTLLSTNHSTINTSIQGNMHSTDTSATQNILLDATLPILYWYSQSEFVALHKESLLHPDLLSTRRQAFHIHLEEVFKQIYDIIILIPVNSTITTATSTNQYTQPLLQHIKVHIEIALSPEILHWIAIDDSKNDGVGVGVGVGESSNQSSYIISSIRLVFDRLTSHLDLSAGASDKQSFAIFHQLFHTISKSVVKWNTYITSKTPSIIENKIFKQNSAIKPSSVSTTWSKLMFATFPGSTDLFNQFHSILQHFLKIILKNYDNISMFVKTGLVGHCIDIVSDSLLASDTMNNVLSFITSLSASASTDLPEHDNNMNKKDENMLNINSLNSDLLSLFAILPTLLDSSNSNSNSNSKSNSNSDQDNKSISTNVTSWLRFVGTLLTVQSTPLQMTDGFQASAYKALLNMYIKPAIQHLASSAHVDSDRAVLLCLRGIFKRIPVSGRKLMYQFCQSLNPTSAIIIDQRVKVNIETNNNMNVNYNVSDYNYQQSQHNAVIQAIKLNKFSLLSTYTSCVTMFDNTNSNNLTNSEGNETSLSRSQYTIHIFYSSAKQISDDLPQLSSLIEGNILSLFQSIKHVSAIHSNHNETVTTTNTATSTATSTATATAATAIVNEHEIITNTATQLESMMDIIKQIKSQSDLFIGLFLACLSSSKLEKLLGIKLSSASSYSNFRKRKINQNQVGNDEILKKISNIGRDGLATWVHFYINKLVTIVHQFSPFFIQLHSISGRNNNRINSNHSYNNLSIIVYEFVELILVQLEDLFQLHMTWYGTSFGLLSDLCCQLISILLTQLNQSTYNNHDMMEKGNDNNSTILRCFNRVSRVFKMLADNQEITKHAPFIFASILQYLSQKNLSDNRYLHALLPGVFALLDKCRQRNRKQIYELLPMTARLFYDELYPIYLRDYKFGASEV